MSRAKCQVLRPGFIFPMSFVGNAKASRAPYNFLAGSGWSSFMYRLFSIKFSELLFSDNAKD